MSKDDTTLSVLIADHEPEVRQALRLVCEESLGLTISAEASNYDELLLQINTLHPDILLLEWELPDLQPISLLNELHTTHSVSTVVMGRHPEARTKALESGTDGFVYKGDPPDELIHLLRTIIEARSYA
ncbi:MAG TPA: response regulator transcription factor [Phototrophicaceae bacterium]|nr:response regulator transcription factor [Phototrophicaceae bacterium]